MNRSQDRARRATRRAAQRDVIELSDSSDNEISHKTADFQPAQINKSEVDSVSSSEVVELQEKLIELERKKSEIEKKNADLQEKLIKSEEARQKSDDMYQRACRAAGEAQARVRLLENAIDSKQNVIGGTDKKDELLKTLADVSKQLDAAKEEAYNANSRAHVIANRNAAMQRDWTNWADQMEFQKHQMRQRIAQLTHQVGQYEAWMTEYQEYEQQQQQQLQQLQPPQFDDIGNPIDVFQLCLPDTEESIAFDSAHTQLLAKFSECGEEKWERHCNTLDLTLYCGLCDKVRDKKIIHHFVSVEHGQKMLATGAAVSLAALEFWLDEMQKAAAAAAPAAGLMLPPPVPIPTQPADDAAPAASQSDAENMQRESTQESSVPK